MRALFLASILLVGCGGTVITSESGDAATSDTGDGGSTRDVATDTLVDAGEACGGSIGRSCADGFWCAFAEGACNVPGGTGVCRKREALPCAAPRPGDEVCGCDAKVYESPCAAAKAGSGIRKNGPC